MYRLTKYHLLGGGVFFVLIVGGSLLYRWHVLRTEPEMPDPQRRRLQVPEGHPKNTHAREEKTPL